jgi:hypothetical protein
MQNDARAGQRVRMIRWPGQSTVPWRRHRASVRGLSGLEALNA